MFMHVLPARVGCVVVTAAMTVAAAVGCSDVGSPAAPSPLLPATGATAAAAPSEANTNAPVDPDLAAVRRATSHFHDVVVARAAGYTTENEPCVASPLGAMGIHAPNFSLIGDPALDPLRPEVLLYAPTPNGGYRLIGVEYFQAVLLRNLATNEIAPRFETAPWDPGEYEIVNPRPQLFGESFHLTPPPVATVPWHWSLHVWVWAHNPSGTFAEWNPSLACS
jgi:hypothetical protein